MGQKRIAPPILAWLRTQMDDWQAEGLVSGDQAEQILQRYGASRDDVSERQSTAIHVLMGVAAGLIGLAVLLLVGSNWPSMPKALKLVLIFGAVIGTHATGFHIRYQRRSRLLSEIFFLLGCLLYGSGIWLVAQIFHLNAHYPDGIWWWAVGVLPFAVCLETPLLHALLVALLATWAGTEILGFRDFGGWFFGRWHIFPNAACTLPLLALPGFAWAYRKNSVVTVALYVPLLAWWVILQSIFWSWADVNPVYVVGAVGGLFALLAESHQSGNRMAIPYRLYGVLLIAGTLSLLSSYDFNEWMPNGDVWSPGISPMLVLVSLSALVVFFTAACSRASDGGSSTLFERLKTRWRQQWPPIAMILLMAGFSILNGRLRPIGLSNWAAILTTILANAAMLGLSMWLIRIGLREDRGAPFVVGVVYFLFWSVLRYIDLFGDFGGMLGASLMFFLCGAALFGVAHFWKRRKEPSPV